MDCVYLSIGRYLLQVYNVLCYLGVILGGDVEEYCGSACVNADRYPDIVLGRYCVVYELLGCLCDSEIAVLGIPGNIVYRQCVARAGGYLNSCLVIYGADIYRRVCYGSGGDEVCVGKCFFSYRLCIILCLLAVLMSVALCIAAGNVNLCAVNRYAARNSEFFKLGVAALMIELNSYVRYGSRLGA